MYYGFSPVPRRPTIDESIFEQSPYSRTPTGFITQPMGNPLELAADYGDDSDGGVGLKVPSLKSMTEVAILGAATGTLAFYLSGGNHTRAGRVALATVALALLMNSKG